NMSEDSGRGYRRVVASPFPKEIIELKAIENLYRQNFTIIAAGGGGIPVISQDGILKGVDAVIDKDKASALLAVNLKADLLMISTGVSHVSISFNKPLQKQLNRVSLEEIKKHLLAGEFAPGSMAPKIEAAVYYLENGGKEVIITNPEHLAQAFFEGFGTHIVKD
ncbi:MAG: carbamate kinase, partial [Spirochaetaceae bacterium]|nr:carbamate kinase [Spirochaetaceae bacterium]